MSGHGKVGQARSTRELSGGVHVEGNLIEPTHVSLVGLYPIHEPSWHDGGLARLFNEEFGIGCRLTAVPMKNWSRRL